MKTLLAICVVAVSALAAVGCLSEPAPQIGQSEAISAVETRCLDVEEYGDGTVLFCSSFDNGYWCCCDHVLMETGEVFGQTCLHEPS